MKQLGSKLLLLLILILSSSYLTADPTVSQIEKSYSYYLNGQYILAELGYRESIAIDSLNTLAHEGLCYSLIAMAKYDEAKIAAENGLDLCNPNYSFSRILGNLYYLEKDYYKSIHHYQNALLFSENKEIDLTALGLSYSYLYYLKTSKAYLKKALSVNADYLLAKTTIEALDNLPYYFTLSSSYYQIGTNNYSLANAATVTKGIFTTNISYNHYKKDSAYRDAYSIGLKANDSGFNYGLELSYLDGNYDLLYNAYGGLTRIEKEFIHANGKATTGYAFSYFWYDVLSSIQNSIWLYNKINKLYLRAEVTNIALDYEVADKDENNFLYLGSVSYDIFNSLKLFSYASWGSHEFYYSPLGYIIDNYNEPSSVYGGGLFFQYSHFEINGTVSNDSNDNVSFGVGFKVNGSVK